ncbi:MULTISPECIES: DUF4375 domain-containing protein [unclassified Duganella]|uniref:DMP19 family protein n=1 Tax=unclassified Duganella TaxID=2636909 RepID=UPI000E35099A|nr:MULTISPECIES: DUF4375 domain-containing protein [unclassified Duganella]RFP09933.1 DUF4375 domain-containing protein [Duganella sp. BJB475]RFP25764.1 DUF4375 domain-containing protein [Duganella sp. BJB476]
MNNLEDAFAQACRRFDGTNFSQLDEIDRILVTIYGLEADVNNGGFDQYYFNGAGDQAFFAVDALHCIGAHRMAEIVSRANAVFGPNGPSQLSPVRQAQLFLVAPNDVQGPAPWEQLDRAFYAYPDDIATLLTTFLSARGMIAPC